MPVNSARHASLRPGSGSSRSSDRAGGKERLGRISKRGDGYIRRLLVHGARAHLSWSRRKKEIRSAWLTALLARRPTNVVLLSLANKTARIAWAMLRRNETYRPQIAAAG